MWLKKKSHQGQKLLVLLYLWGHLVPTPYGLPGPHIHTHTEVLFSGSKVSWPVLSSVPGRRVTLALCSLLLHFPLSQSLVPFSLLYHNRFPTMHHFGVPLSPPHITVHSRQIQMNNFWEWKSPGYWNEWWIDEPNTQGGRKRRQLLNTREREMQRKRERKGDSSSSVNGSAIVRLLGGYTETDSIQTGTAGSTEKLLAVSSHRPDWHNSKNDWQILALPSHTHTLWKALQSGLGPTMALFILCGMLLSGTTSIFTSSKQHHQSSLWAHSLTHARRNVPRGFIWS